MFLNSMRPAARKREFLKNVWVCAERKWTKKTLLGVEAFKMCIRSIDVSNTKITFNHACMKKVMYKSSIRNGVMKIQYFNLVRMF